MTSVARTSPTPVTCFRLNLRGGVLPGRGGVTGNRLFVLVDDDGRRLQSSRTAWPVVVSADEGLTAEVLR